MRRARPLHDTLAAAQRQHLVRSEAEMLRALELVRAVASDASQYPLIGAEIVIVDSFVASRTWIIEDCVGLKITSRGRTPIMVNSSLSCLFDIRCDYVTISDLLVVSAAATPLNTFVKAGAAANALHLRGCAALANRLYVETSSLRIDRTLISGCELFCGVLVDTNESAIQLHGEEQCVSDCWIGAGADDAITIGASGQYARVSGNSFSGRTVDTSASDGDNIFGENTRSGTKTLHADDRDNDEPEGGGGGAYTWYEYPIDEPPASAHAMDDEFPGAALDAKWSWINQGPATATVGGGRVIMDSITSGAFSMKMLVQPVPGAIATTRG
jgi:hypothetical protein